MAARRAGWEDVVKQQVVILGAGFAGHTAALHLARLAQGKADITVVSPNNRFTWFYSLIWVGTGAMSEDETVFALAPVYEKIGVEYADARATSVDLSAQTVEIRRADGRSDTLRYDFLINATGPYLNFEGTPGLGPEAGTTLSVCSVEHAVQTRDRYLALVADLKKGLRRRMVIGVGHPAATCE